MPVCPAGMVTNGENAVRKKITAANITTVSAMMIVLRGMPKGLALPVFFGAVPVSINSTLLFGMRTV